MTPEMTAEEVAEYSAMVDDIIATLNDPTKAIQNYPTARDLVEELIPRRPENIKVLKAVRGAALLHLPLAEYRRALTKWENQWEMTAKREAKSEANKQTAQAAMLAEIGGIAKDERTFVTLFMAKRGYDMRYDRSFTSDDGPILLTDIRNDAHLTASTLKLNPPSGKLLGSANIDRAIDEWQTERREGRRQIVMAQIERLPAHVKPEAVLADWKTVCQAYFADDPGFCGAAVCDHIWQVKRKLWGLPIDQHHCLVVVGAQNAGKTWLGRKLQEPISELAIEANLLDLLDPRQMDMVQNYSVFCDEFSFADRAEAAALKSLITGAVVTRRPMRSNTGQSVPIHCTLHGNSNRGLGNLIFDSSGMRRFVEVRAKARGDIEPNWHLIERFDWLELWQVVDVHAESPLAPYAEMLNIIQEEIRNPDNVELWLRDFEFSRNCMPCKADTTDDKKVEFWAAELYSQFRLWETQFDPAYRGTSLNRWGREMKSLIDQRQVPQWYRRTVGNKTVYGMVHNSTPASGYGAVVPLLRRT